MLFQNAVDGSVMARSVMNHYFSVNARWSVTSKVACHLLPQTPNPQPCSKSCTEN